MKFTTNTTAGHIAYVISRALILDKQLCDGGPHRGREKELAAMKWIAEQLTAAHPEDANDAYELAHENAEYYLRKLAEWDRVQS